MQSAFIADQVREPTRPSSRRRTASEKSLLKAHLPAAIAGAASCWAFTRCGPRAAASFAGFVPAYHDARLRAKNSLFKFNGDVFAQIRAALHAAAAASTSSQHIAKAEELAKDFAQILERRALEPTT